MDRRENVILLGMQNNRIASEEDAEPDMPAVHASISKGHGFCPGYSKKVDEGGFPYPGILSST